MHEQTIHSFHLLSGKIIYPDDSTILFYLENYAGVEKSRAI